MEIVQSLFRWIHVVAGILWIGLLYFFNFVNSSFAPTMDGETKKKVVPQLMPRALFWFRWGAAWTWVTGLLLLMMVFYHGGLLFEDPNRVWGTASTVMVLFTFFGFFIYDLLMKSSFAKGNMKGAVGVGFLLIAVFIILGSTWAGWSYRAVTIHLGALFGTIMAMNVWMRIWPAQRKIVTAVKNGEAPDAVVVGLAGLRSKQNTYLSIPLVWTMLNAHTTWASVSPLWTLGFILAAWYATTHLFKKAGKVQGF